MSRGAVDLHSHTTASDGTLSPRELVLAAARHGVTVLAVDALRGLALLASRKQQSATGYHYIFLDPPYAAAEDYSRVLEFLGSADLLAPGGVVVAEHRRNFDLAEELGALRRFRVLRQGDAALSFYRRRGETGRETSGENDPAE